MKIEIYTKLEYEVEVGCELPARVEYVMLPAYNSENPYAGYVYDDGTVEIVGARFDRKVDVVTAIRMLTERNY